MRSGAEFGRHKGRTNRGKTTEECYGRLFAADYNNWQNLQEKRGLSRDFGGETDNEEFHFTDER
jgi:hypothetical protein